jgi:hypothetical protein
MLSEFDLDSRCSLGRMDLNMMMAVEEEGEEGAKEGAKEAGCCCYCCCCCPLTLAFRFQCPVSSLEPGYLVCSSTCINNGEKVSR